MASVRKRKWTHKGVEKEAWIVSYTDQNGKRRLKTFDKKKDADRHRSEVEVEIERGTHVSGLKAGTVRKVGEEFIRHTEARYRDGQVGWNRVREIKQHLDVRVFPILGAIKFEEIQLVDVERLHDQLVRVRGNAAITSKKTIITLAQLEDFALKRRYARRPVVRPALEEFRRIRHNSVATFLPEQIQAIFRYIEQSRPGQGERERLRNRLFVYLAAATGLRYGEIAALSPASLMLDKGFLTVTRSVLLNGDLKDPKSAAGVRTVPIPDILAAMLTDWTRRHYRPNPDDLLFTTVAGEFIKHPNFWRTWTGILRGSGVGERDKQGRRYHFHALRHFAASMMVSHNLPLPDVAEMLGHSKVDMTLRVYAHPLKPFEQRQQALTSAVKSLTGATTEQQQPLSA